MDVLLLRSIQLQASIPVANFAYSNTLCLGQVVTFTDLSSANGGPGIQTWHWNFDDPLSGATNISTLQNPPHTFMTIGTHNVILIITSVNGCVSTDTIPVDIKPLPFADFTYTTSCEGIGTTVYRRFSFQCKFHYFLCMGFGDGSATSPLPSPFHVYSSYGMKTVRLTVTNDMVVSRIP